MFWKLTPEKFRLVPVLKALPAPVNRLEFMPVANEPVAGVRLLRFGLLRRLLKKSGWNAFTAFSPAVMF
jgi:hypothetical protein